MQTRRLETIISKMMFKKHYWGFLFSRVKRIEDPNLFTFMGVTVSNKGENILVYNPKLLEEVDDSFIRECLIHESLHIVNQHQARYLRMKDFCKPRFEIEFHKFFGVCCDLAVNSVIDFPKDVILKTSGQKLYFLHPETVDKSQTKSKKDLKRGEATEYYFDELNINENSEQIFSNCEDSSDHSLWNKIFKNSSKGGEETTNEMNSDELASLIEKNTNSLIKETYKLFKECGGSMRGTFGGAFEQYIEEQSDVVPFYEIITKLVKATRIAGYKKSFERINKKLAYLFLFPDEDGNLKMSPFPGRESDRSFKACLVIDTSGSMSNQDIGKALCGVRDMFEKDRNVRVHVIECDAQIQREYTVSKISEIKREVKGRGGTVLFPGLQRAKDLDCDIVLVFTDGYCENINEIDRSLLPKKIVWVLTEHGTSSCFDEVGIVVKSNLSRLDRR